MPLNSPISTAYDPGFVGFASRLNPVALPAGVLQLSENMRLDRGVAKVRKGAKRLADDILTPSEPITLDFTFGVTLPVNLNFYIPSDPDGLILRDSYEGGIFASCVYRSPLYNVPGESIILAGSDRAFIWRDTTQDYLTDNDGNLVTDHGGDPIRVTMLQTELLYPSGETIEATDTVSLVQAFDRVYLLREASQLVAGWTPLSATVSVSGTTATVSSAGHGYSAGMRVRIEGSSVAGLNGHEFDIVTAAANSFTITVPSGTASDLAAGITVRRTKPPLYWDGQQSTNFVKSPGGVPAEGPTYKRMRSVGWGVYVNNRFVVPDGPDTVALSDILQPNLYDPYWQSFRANQGSNDSLVAVHPWVDGTFLVFMRKSIWLAQVNQFASTDGSGFSIDTPITKLELLTDEVGCAARQSIQTAGQFVYFLSDSGVYRLDARLDLKLRGDTKPLSDAISDQFARINWATAHNAVGLWYDNRYYIAIPQDGYEENVALFIYSALNDAWETKDFYGFGVDNLLVSNYQGQRRLFIPNRAGKLFLMDEQESGDDKPSALAGGITPVPGKIKTRRFGFESMGTKRFNRVLADVVLPDTAQIRVTADTYNPDKTEELVPGLTNMTGTEEDYALKLPIRRKAHFCDITIETLAGRPEIRTLSMEAAGPSLPPTDTRTAA